MSNSDLASKLTHLVPLSKLYPGYYVQSKQINIHFDIPYDYIHE